MNNAPAFAPEIDANHPSGAYSQDAWPTRDYYYFDNHDEHDLMREALTRIPEVTLLRLDVLVDMEHPAAPGLGDRLPPAHRPGRRHQPPGAGGPVATGAAQARGLNPWFIRCGQLDTEISRQACEIYRWRTMQRIAALYPDLADACATYLADPRRVAVKALVEASPTRARVRDHSVEREARLSEIGCRVPDLNILAQLGCGPALSHRIAAECSMIPEILNGLSRRGASNTALENTRTILQERFFAALASESA